MSDIPRRIDINRYVPAETAIREAILRVEEMPADVRLTDAVVLLGQAKDKVADFVDDNKVVPLSAIEQGFKMGQGEMHRKLYPVIRELCDELNRQLWDAINHHAQSGGQHRWLDHPIVDRAKVLMAELARKDDGENAQ